MSRLRRWAAFGLALFTWSTSSWAQPLRGTSPLPYQQTWQDLYSPKAHQPSEVLRNHQLDDAVSGAVLTGKLFAKYLTYQSYRVTIDKELYEGGFVHGPGHHISAIAALVFAPDGTPYATFKTGDTRLSRYLRGEPYVSTSGIAGRWDKSGASAGKIVVDELSEEVGGRAVEGTFRRLGDSLAPTMPFESTEADEFFMAAVEITGAPTGDGGQMEVVGLIGPVFYSPSDAMSDMDSAKISDSARARAMFGRAWDTIGYLPDLGAYVQDYPDLLARFDTLGLGPNDDLRKRVPQSMIPEPIEQGTSLSSHINAVSVVEDRRVSLGEVGEMMDAEIQHAVVDGPTRTSLPDIFPSQYLRMNYDRAKIALYYPDPQLGPMVEMRAQARPPLAFAPGNLAPVRRDLRDVRVSKNPYSAQASQTLPNHLDFDWGHPVKRELQSTFEGVLHQLSNPNAASSGQSDLFYWSFSCRVDPPAESERTNFVTLAEALRLCRTGHGDAQSEATLLRLATHLDWLPQLGMSRSKAFMRIHQKS